MNGAALQNGVSHTATIPVVKTERAPVIAVAISAKDKPVRLLGFNVFFRLGTFQAHGVNLPMRAIYGEEMSGLDVVRTRRESNSPLRHSSKRSGVVRRPANRVNGPVPASTGNQARLTPRGARAMS